MYHFIAIYVVSQICCKYIIKKWYASINIKKYLSIKKGVTFWITPFLLINDFRLLSVLLHFFKIHIGYIVALLGVIVLRAALLPCIRVRLCPLCVGCVVHVL